MSTKIFQQQFYSNDYKRHREAERERGHVWPTQT